MKDPIIYLVDYIKEKNNAIISWKYNPQDSNVYAVEIRNSGNDLIDRVLFPRDHYNATDLKGRQTVEICPVNKDLVVLDGIKLLLSDPYEDISELNVAPVIGIKSSNAGAGFMIKDNHKPLIIKGVNYVRLRNGDHSTFEAETKISKADYNPYHSESMLRMLIKNGFNSVRVFIASGRNDSNPGISGSKSFNKILYAPYMDNIIDFLKRAQKLGIFVLPTFGDGELPRNQWIKNRLPAELKTDKGISEYLIPFYKEAVHLKAEYILAFMDYIKLRAPNYLSSIIAIQLQNEYCLSSEVWPFTVKDGQLKMFWGTVYSMSDINSRQQLADDATINYHNTVVESIKAKYPDLLISEGLFTLQAVGKTPENSIGLLPGSFTDSRYPPVLPVIGRTKLDFIDIHLYRTKTELSVKESFDNDLMSMRYDALQFQNILKDKPVIMGEFGSFVEYDMTINHAAKNVLLLKELGLQKGFAGYMYWTFDTFEQTRLFNMMSGNGQIFEFLKN